MPQTIKPKMIKVYLAQAETGWAEDLGDGTVRVLNLPLEGNFNVDDIVRVSKGGEGTIRTLGELVTRKWPRKVGLRYSPVLSETGQKLWNVVVQKNGWRMEGMMPGIALVSCPKDADLTAAAKEAGVDISNVEELLT